MENNFKEGRMKIIEGIPERGLSFNEMEEFKRKLKPLKNPFLSKIKKEDQYMIYSIFFRALASDLESRRGMFPADFLKICKRIVYGPDSAFIGYDQTTHGIVFDSLPSIADTLLPPWFAKELREIITVLGRP